MFVLTVNESIDSGQTRIAEETREDKTVGFLLTEHTNIVYNCQRNF